MSSIVLRDYQEQAIEGLRQAMREGSRRNLLVAPTGAGKTTIAGKIIQNVCRKEKRAIFLAHRSELIEQCSKRLDMFGIEHGIIQSKHPRANRSLPVQVASIQTLVRRDHWDADLVVIDEAHRSAAKTYSKILDRYDTSTAVLGITATPWREDGSALGDLYERLIETLSTQELVDRGFLINPTVFGAEKVDLSNVDVGAKGDYNRGQLEDAMKKTVLHGDLVKNWAEICGKRLDSETRIENEKVVYTTCNACTVVFAVSVEQSKQIADQFKEAGVPAAHLDAGTPPGERARILEDLAQRRLSVVVNVGLLTEGYDLPILECVMLARPTRSKSLYLQKVGRLMRVHEEKRFAYLIDHANCVRSHGFATDPREHSLSQSEARPRKNSAEKPLKQCPRCEAVVSLGAIQCNECGYEWPQRTIDYTEEKLVELNSRNIENGKPRAHVVPQQERQDTFDKLCLKCKEKNYKPNWARMQYSNIYGEWPSKKTGISMPKFFWIYENSYQKYLRKKQEEDST